MHVNVKWHYHEFRFNLGGVIQIRVTLYLYVCASGWKNELFQTLMWLLRMHHRNVFSLYLLKVHRLNYFAASCFFCLILSLFQFLCETFAKSFTNHFYAYLNVKSTFHSQCEIVSFLMKYCNHSSHDKPVVSAKGSYFGTFPHIEGD